MLILLSNVKVEGLRLDVFTTRRHMKNLITISFNVDQFIFKSNKPKPSSALSEAQI